MRGVVIKSTGSWYWVLETESLKVFEARIRGRFKLIKKRLTNPLAVGDYVEFELEKGGSNAWITKIQQRKNYLIRKAVNLSKECHIIASNIDLACFLFTLKAPETSLGFLDRFLVCCEAYSVPPLILFNKMDLLGEDEKESCRALEAIYRRIGYDTLMISSYSKLNLEALRDKTKNKVSLFFGHSATGKSTLISTLDPSLVLKTGEISDVHMKGKHTTTFVQMHFSSFGARIIDTPGIKEFAMLDTKKAEIQDYFPEIFRRKEYCRFSNCLHINEPNCSILKDMKAAHVEESRYATYLKLVEEAAE